MKKTLVVVSHDNILEEFSVLKRHYADMIMIKRYMNQLTKNRNNLSPDPGTVVDFVIDMPKGYFWLQDYLLTRDFELSKLFSQKWNRKTLR